MKLASIDNKTRDGQLVVVSKDLTKAIKVPEIANTMQAAIDNWAENEPRLNAVYQELNANQLSDAFDFSSVRILAPLPRAYHWADGSAYVTHVELVRKARNAELPESFWTDPLMYMGASDAFIGANDDIEIQDIEIEVPVEEEVIVKTRLTMPSRKLKIKISNELLSELEKMQINFKLN